MVKFAAFKLHLLRNVIIHANAKRSMREVWKTRPVECDWRVTLLTTFLFGLRKNKTAQRDKRWPAQNPGKTKPARLIAILYREGGQFILTTHLRIVSTYAAFLRLCRSEILLFHTKEDIKASRADLLLLTTFKLKMSFLSVVDLVSARTFKGLFYLSLSSTSNLPEKSAFHRNLL